MDRIIGIDYGRKRVGVAVSDPLGVFASALDTVPAAKIIEYIKNYAQKETITRFVVGYPMNMNNKPSEAAADVEIFLKNLAKAFPGIPVLRRSSRSPSFPGKARRGIPAPVRCRGIAGADTRTLPVQPAGSVLSVRTSFVRLPVPFRSSGAVPADAGAETVPFSRFMPVLSGKIPVLYHFPVLPLPWSLCPSCRQSTDAPLS